MQQHLYAIEGQGFPQQRGWLQIELSPEHPRPTSLNNTSSKKNSNQNNGAEDTALAVAKMKVATFDLSTRTCAECQRPSQGLMLKT